MEAIAMLSAIIWAVVLPIGGCYYLVRRANTKWHGTQSQLEDRIQVIESRLSDIQEVVISIDDQLKRSSETNMTPTVSDPS